MREMEERILTLARIAAPEAEEPLLTALCAAAGRYWEDRLRPGLSPEDCGQAFPCAAAFTAAADASLGQSGGGLASVTAGEISLRGRGAADSAALAEGMRQAAERLMAPYAEAEDFAFRGVRG